MTEQVAPLQTDVAVNNMLTMLQNQLNNTLSLIDTHTDLVGESLNASVEDYNKLCELFEAETKKVSSLELELNSLKSTHKELEIERSEELTKLKSDLASARIKLGTFSELKAELKRLKELDPDGLKKRLAKARATAEERLASNNLLKKDNREYRKENSLLKSKNADLTQTALDAADRIESLETQVALQDGAVFQKQFEGKNGLFCVVNVFNWSLSFKPQDQCVSVISDFDFHVEVRTNWGIGIIPSCSDWLVPFMPSCSDLEPYLPSELQPAIQDFFYERALVSHSHLVDRVEWGKSEELELVEGLSQKQIMILNDSSFFSVYAVSHVPKYELVRRVKGLGQKGADQVIEAVKAHVKQWESNNWTREQRGLSS